MNGTELFAGDHLPRKMEQQRAALTQAAAEEVATRPESRDEETVRNLVRRFVVEPPVIDDQGIKKSIDKDFVDLRGTPEAFYRDITSDRTEVDFAVYEVPFTGESVFFSLRPSTYSLSPPSADVRGNSLKFRYPVFSSDPSKIREQFERDLAAVEASLSTQHNDVRAFMDALPETAAKAVRDARERHRSKEDFLKGL